MIRYSHAMTCLMAYYNKKGTETISIVLQTSDKIIQMAQQEKKGRNQIVYELAKQNIKASAGSVSNILRKCKEGKDKNNLSGQDKDDLVPPEATISTTIIDPPSSNLGDGLICSSTDGNGIRKAATGLVHPVKECPLSEDTIEKDVNED